MLHYGTCKYWICMHLSKDILSNLNWQKYMQMGMVFWGIAKCKTKSSHDNQNFTNG